MRALAFFALLAVACTRAEPRGASHEPLVVGAAGSLAAPLKTACDSFTARTGIAVVLHSAGSVELARRVIDLQEIPDVIAVADEAVFPAYLQPGHVDWWGTFARNRVVVAMAPAARGAAGIDSTNWWRVLARPGVEVGRSAAALDPAGYRALMVLDLAGKVHADGGLAGAVLANSPPRGVRPKSADLIALLETGALDYAFVYESSARLAKLRFVILGPAIDLSDDARAADYATVGVMIPGRTKGSNVEIRGAPIRYALSVPRDAAHHADAMRLADWLLSSDGRRVLAAAGLDTVTSRIENPQLKAAADAANAGP